MVEFRFGVDSMVRTGRRARIREVDIGGLPEELGVLCWRASPSRLRRT